jgi:hypothetical protein
MMHDRDGESVVDTGRETTAGDGRSEGGWRPRVGD